MTQRTLVTLTTNAMLASMLVLGATVGDVQPSALASGTAASQARTVVPASSRPILSAADRASFKRLSRRLGGRNGVAVSPLGRGQRVQGTGTLRSAVAWSTSKAPIAMAVFAAGGASSQRANLREAITASDNTAAAEGLWSSLGSGKTAATKASQQLRLTGDRRTVIEARRLRSDFTPFGQTSWRLSDQARFSAGMVCLRAGRQVLSLMGQIISAHRWGLGSAQVKAQFKGGWGPGARPGVAGGYLDRQMGIVTVRGKRLAVAIATAPTNGDHETGTAHLTRIARWVVAHVAVRAVPRKPRCTTESPA